MMDKWKLDPKEVSVGRTAGYQKSKGHPDKTLRMPTVVLVHLPTGIRVERSRPFGRYSRKECTKIYDVLQNELFQELEKLVAAHLHKAGR